MMKAFRCAVGLALVLVADRAAPAAPPDAIDVVRGFYAALLQMMRQGPALGPAGRYEHLAPAVHNTYDLGFMTRLAVGPGWASLSSAEQQRVAEAFGRYVAATWADRFDRYAGERLEIVDGKTFGRGLIVETRTGDADGKPVAIDYAMRSDAAGWRVSDVYLGTIRELAARRSEFSAILRDRAIAGLITALNQKSSLLSGSAANAS